MEYISAKEFLKKPKEVQEVFIDWWKLEKGNLYCIDAGCIHGGELEDYRIEVIEENETLKKYFVCPLLTECQLRKFIEDKTRYKVEAPWHGCYDIYLVDQLTGQEVIKDYFNLDTDLLQAYWTVACEIAKEG
nr:MAG TPA: hypothetical protein [Caudoviricetes sp.]